MIKWVDIITSTFFVFNLAPQHVTGFVWGSWSIGVEMGFYFILPILAFIITTPARAAAFFAVTCYLAVSWSKAFDGATGDLKMFGYCALIPNLPYFAAGILIFFIWDRFKTKAASAGTLVALIGAALTCAIIFSAPGISHLMHIFGVQTVKAVMLAIFVIGMALRPTNFAVNSITKTLGEASFSIYLWHIVVVVLLLKCDVYKVIYEQISNRDLAVAGCAAITFAILIPLSLASHRWIEVPGNRLAAHAIAANGRWIMPGWRSRLEAWVQKAMTPNTDFIAKAMEGELTSTKVGN